MGKSIKVLRRILIILLSGFILSTRIATAKVLKVGKDHEFQTIQAAINHAAAGDTIYVTKGIYREKNILIEKPLSLIGQDYPVLDGEKKYEIISIKANLVKIKGFKLINSGVSSLIDIAGIKVYGKDRIVIANNILDGTFFGIYLEKSSGSLIANNKITGRSKTEQQSGNGIHLWQCDSIRVLANTVTGHRDGIYFEFVTHSLIWRNQAVNNVRYGLHFMFSNNDIYLANTFKNNNAGVSVMFSQKVRMFNNRFEDNWGDGCYGIFLKEISDSYVYGNQFLRNTTGISIEGSNRILIKHNLFMANGWAMQIDASCLEDTISRNNFIGNSFDIATNGTAIVNCFNYNYWDKYEGYDLNKDIIGDVSYHPVSIFSMIVAKNPTAMVLFRSVIATLFDKIEKLIPGITPEHLVDHFPNMKPLKL